MATPPLLLPILPLRIIYYYNLKGQLQRVVSLKGLGVTHELKLIFDVHINNIVTNASKSLGLIRRSSVHISEVKTFSVILFSCSQFLSCSSSYNTYKLVVLKLYKKVY